MFTDFNTLHREAFMVILNIWDIYSKEGINNAARKVGITPTKLSIEMMRQDRVFERAAAVIDTNDDNANSSAISTSSTLSISLLIKDVAHHSIGKINYTRQWVS